MQTLYTFGYLAGRSERILTELIAVKTPIVDVRYNPTSKRWQWTQEAVMTRDGIMYYHLPQLGNVLYKEALTGKFVEPRIELHSQKAGMLALQAILREHGRCAIFCACNNKTMCHRVLVARLAHEQFGVKVVHL